MKPDKQQVPQLIVLGVLVLFCIGYVSFKVLSPSSQKPPAPVNKAIHKADSSSTSSESKDAEASNIPIGTFPDLTVAQPRRDPFAPVISGGTNNVELPKPVAEPRPTPAPVRVVSNPTQRIPRIEANPFNPFSRTTSKPIQTEQIQVQEQDPEFTLTGVIRGERNVAIIRSGESGRYVVKQGQLIDGRYKVESVSDDGATLVYKGRRIHVKLGGVKNAS